MSAAKLPQTRRGLHRILVVDAVELIRIGIVNVLSAASQLVVCALAGDCDDIADLVEHHKPHLVIADPFQRGRAGVVWIKDFTTRFPQTKLLVVSVSEEAIYAERALRAGAAGYWMKTGAASDLLKAAETILSGGLYLSPKMNSLALHRLINGAAQTLGISVLSDRELQIFAMIAERHGTGRIARELSISRKTVETHYEHIKLKLGYRNAEALKRGAERLLGTS